MTTEKSENESFTVTEEHIELLQHAYVTRNDTEYGAPTIDPKRPYGDSDVEASVVEILGWDVEGGDEDDDPAYLAAKAKAGEVHEEMVTVLEILLCYAPWGIQPGEYVKMSEGRWMRREVVKASKVNVKEKPEKP